MLTKHEREIIGSLVEENEQLIQYLFQNKDLIPSLIYDKVEFSIVVNNNHLRKLLSKKRVNK